MDDDTIIYTLVEQEGRIDATDAQVALKCSYAQALNTLNLLERKGMLKSILEGKKKFFMINSCGTEPDQPKFPSPRSLTARVSRSPNTPKCSEEVKKHGTKPTPA